MNSQTRRLDNTFWKWRWLLQKPSVILLTAGAPAKLWSLHPVLLGKPQMKYSKLNCIVQTKQIIWNSTGWQKQLKFKLKIRGGVLEDVLGLEDTF